MKKSRDDFKIQYYLYTFVGYLLFILIFIIQFFIFTPLTLLASLIGLDKNKSLFTYATKLSTRLFFTIFIGHKIDINLKDVKAPKKGERRLYLVNHSSMYDVIMTYLLPGPSKFIIKDKWVKKPFIGWMQGLAGNIVVGEEKEKEQEVTQGPPPAIAQTIDAFNRGIPIIVFPEGTRSEKGFIQRLKKGSFVIATEAACDLVIVIMDDWYTIKPGGLMIRDIKPVVRILPTLTYEEYKHLDYNQLTKAIRYIMAKELYQIRENRKIKEPHYYRNRKSYVEIDQKAYQDLLKLHEELKSKGIEIKGRTDLV